MVYSYLLSFFLRIHVTKPLSSPPSIIKETEYYLLIFRSELHTWNPIFGFRIFMWEMLFLTTLTWNREVCPVSRGFKIVKCTCIQTKQLQPKVMHQKSSSFEFVIFPFQLWIFAGWCMKGFVCEIWFFILGHLAQITC